jgi:hypothetical protein
MEPSSPEKIPRFTGLFAPMPGVSRAGTCSLLARHYIEAIACVAGCKVLQVCHVNFCSDR